MRIALTHIARRGNGTTCLDTEASLSLYSVAPNLAPVAGGGPAGPDAATQAAAATVWTGAVGGSSQNSFTTPITPESGGSGRYSWWVPGPGLYYLHETIDGERMPPVAWYAIQGRFDDWQPMTPLLNSWVIDGTNPPGYTKDSSGIVHTRGHATRGVAATGDIFVMPAGYRVVGGTKTFAMQTGTGTISGDVKTTGGIGPSAVVNDIRLDGLLWLAEA